MQHTAYICVLIVLSIQHYCNSENVFKDKEFIYSYKSSITTYNRVSEDRIAQWTLSGKLIVQQLEKFRIFKLVDLKTSVYNGLQSKPFKVIEKDVEISKDTRDINLPFAMYTNGIQDVKISVISDEAPWAINMKKAIASVFVIDPNISEDFDDIEQTLYGNCAVSHKLSKIDQTKFIIKTIDHYNCTEEPNFYWSNVNAPEVNTQHKFKQYSTKRYYTIFENNELVNVKSSSKLTHQEMPDVQSTQHMDQLQYFKLISSSEDFTRMTIEKNDLQVNVISEDAAKRKDPTKPGKELLEEFKSAYKAFQVEYTSLPLNNLDIRQNDTIAHMYQTLLDLKKSSLTTLSKEILSSDDHQLTNVFLSLIPYVGTAETVELIQDLAKNDILNELLLIKIMAIFPLNIINPNEDLVKKCEVLKDLHSVKTKEVRNAGVLSFASLVASVHKSKLISKKLMRTYLDEYYNRFNSAKEHEDQITWLLGLINMGAGLDTDTIMAVIENPDKSNHIQSLAITGFKKYLISSSKELYAKFWPKVQNSSISFDVRAASLDLLLSANLLEEQFNEIVHTFDKKHVNRHEEHLANYVFSTMHSLQNTTGYKYNNFSDYATAKLQQGNLPNFPKSWTTGNYRVAFTDVNNNFGVSLDTRLIADPITNAVNTIQLTFDHFAMPLNLGKYSLYLKLEGFLDMMFINAFIYNRLESETTFDALTELIEKFKYNLKNGKIVHVDIVLFLDDRAVFAMHKDKNTIVYDGNNPLVGDLMKLFVSYASVTYPIKDYVKIVSDLGTNVEINTDMMQYISHDTENLYSLFTDKVVSFTVKQRVYTKVLTSLQAYNPLAHTDLGTFKDHYDVKSLELPIKFSFKNLSVSWKNGPDAFNWVRDNLITSQVNEADVLREYCSECDPFVEVPIGEPAEYILPFPTLGMKLNITKSSASDEKYNLTKTEPRLPSHIVSTHRSNAFAFPPAKLMLYYRHVVYYTRYITNDLDRVSVRSMPAYENPYETELNIILDVDNTFNDNDPIDGIYGNISVSLVNRNSSDCDILSSINSTFNFISAINSDNKNEKPYFENNYTLQMDVLKADKNKSMLCFHRSMRYPNRRSDKMSLEPVNPAEGKTIISWGAVGSFTDSCPDLEYITFNETYTATEEQNRKVIEMKEYKKCQADSKNLKYVPPTEACTATHKAMSLYTVYELYTNLLNSGDEPRKYIDFPDMPEDSDILKIYEYNHLDDGSVNVSISKDLINRVFVLDVDQDFVNYVETSAFVEFMSADPTALAYDEGGVDFGIYAYCDIMPKNMKTFTGNFKPLFEESGEEIVAFVECLNEPRNGLTVQKINDHKLGFNFWSGDNVVTATFENNKLKVKFNGTEILRTNTEQDEHTKIYFLEEDVVYVVDSFVSVYYTTESISIKTLALYNNYICGKCSYSDEL